VPDISNNWQFQNNYKNISIQSMAGN